MLQKADLMDRKIYAVFVAGGSGTRMGGSIPKQFLEIGGIPVLQRTIESFTKACPEASVIVVLPSEHIELWKELCRRNALNCPQTIVEGGMTRFHSVKNALAKVPDGAIVSIHDGVRPFAGKALIRTMIEKMSECDALVPALPVVDSLKYRDGTLPEPDRSAILAVQTPQMFRSELLKKAYRQAYRECFTDDASVAARDGVKISYTDGEKFNIKITTPEDLKLAEFLISSSL